MRISLSATHTHIWHERTCKVGYLDFLTLYNVTPKSTSIIVKRFTLMDEVDVHRERVDMGSTWTQGIRGHRDSGRNTLAVDRKVKPYSIVPHSTVPLGNTS